MVSATALHDVAVASMPVLTAEISTSSADTVDLRAHDFRRQRDDLERCRLVVCDVTAVTAVTPYTPSAANVFRSAWMPAPAIESLPAMVSTARIVAATFRR